MYKPVADHNNIVQRFVSLGIFGRPDAFENATAIGVVNSNDVLIGGVIFHNWQPDHKSIELSAFSIDKRWINRHILRSAFTYVFDQLQSRIAVAQMSEHNAPAMKFWRGIGASLHPVPDLMEDGVDTIVAVLHREVWMYSKFKKEQHNG